MIKRPTPRWHLRGKPHAVQLEALRRADGKKGFAYFMEQGLGKTNVALNEFFDLLGRGLVDRMAVLAPNFVKGNWPDEIAQWVNLGSDSITVWPEEPHDETLIFLMNYEALLHVGGAVMGHWVQEGRTYLVADESQRIKTHNAATTKRALLLSVFAEYTRVMTGTPVVLNVLDYWPQLRFIGEIKGSNPYSFRNTYGRMGGYMGKKIVGTQNEEQLQRILDGCAFRARKVEWTDLPEKLYMNRFFEMQGKQLTMYRDMKRDFYIELSRDRDVAAPMVVTQMMKLQQISRGFIIDELGRAVDIVPPEKNPALHALLDVMEATSGKVIVFCYFRHTVATLTKALAEYRPEVIVGGIGPEAAREARDRFNRNSGCRVIVAQIAAGSVGLTLLGDTGEDRCSTTVFYENTYALGDRAQAEDRNHRHGQDRAVVYIDLVGSPQDRAIAGALQKKKDVIDVIVESIKSSPR